MNFNIYVVGLCIAHMRHVSTYTIQYMDIYFKNSLKYLNHSSILKKNNIK
jgi:hypothetical protein